MRIALVIYILLIINTLSFSQQNVGIGTVTPDASAILDLESTTKGFLMPSMRSVDRKAIANPANGLIVFDRDCGEFYNYYKVGYFDVEENKNKVDSGWVALSNSNTKITEVISNYSAKECDYTIIANANTTDVTITLPLASLSNKGKIFFIKAINTNTGNDAFVVPGSASQFIDGTISSYKFTANYEVISIQSDGDNWWILSKN